MKKAIALLTAMLLGVFLAFSIIGGKLTSQKKSSSNIPIFISQKLYCKNWNIDVIGKDILLPGDEVTFVVYTTEKKDLSNVTFTIYEKSTRKKISSISGQSIAPYPPKGKEYLEFLRFDYGDCGTAYAESWEISDIRKKDDCSELWYYI